MWTMLLWFGAGGVALVVPPAEAARCPAQVGLDEALRLVEDRPDVLAWGSGAKAARREADGVSWLHGTTQLTATPGVRWWPRDQLQPEGSVGLAHSVLLGNLGGARERVAKAHAAVSDEAMREAHLVQRQEVAHRWVDRWRADHAYALAKAQYERTAALADKFERAIGAGVTRAEAATARADASAARVSLLDAEGEVTHTALFLAEAVGCRGEMGVIGEPWAEAGAIASLAEGRRSPAVAKLEAQVEAGAAENDLTTMQTRPQVGVGMTAEVDGTNTFRTMSNLSGTWAVFDGGHAQRAQIAAEVELLKGRARQAQIAEAQTLALYVHEIEHLTETGRVIDEQLLPQLREAVELERQAFALGESTAEPLAKAERVLTGAELRALKLRGDLAEQVVGARLWAAPDEGSR